ncbi:uncharacterized protein JCM6883_004997 [Sporobolomyces salmoneus]|uniref:uncharacterized protein n=1 Tax=Sporobolomyces salmoneus TaxID=183962 RepID=UPI0031705F2E
MSTVSRPPEGRARRVLTTSNTSTNIRSPTLSSSKPIRARVDLSSIASPPVSPSLNASTTSNWTPSQPVRVKAKSTVGVRSAPTTPTVQSNGQFKATPTNGYFRAAMSPQTPSLGGGGGTSRAVSPQQRARSPEVVTVRTRTTSTRAGTVQGVAVDLRGQGDPFPSTNSTNSFNKSTSTPITHLPSSVSVRRLHSPSLRASQRRDHPDQQQHFFSTSTSSSASSALPPLSTSPSSIASSPLTSPNLHAVYEDPSATRYHDHASTSSSIGRKAGSSSNGSSVRRSSGVSSLSSNSIDSNTNTPTAGSGGGGGNGQGLLPAFPHYTSPSLSQSTFTSPPLPSPSSFSNVAPNPHSNPLLRSPTLPSSASTKTLRSVPTHSSTTTSYDFSNERPPRTRTITSSSNGSTQGSSTPFPTISAGSTVSTTTFATIDSPHQGRYQRGRVDQVEWDRAGEARASSPERWNAGTGGGETPTSPRLISTSPTTGGMMSGMESLMRESIEKEIEAKVSRRILDLEIRTSSLLSINAQLERQKLKQTSEIRELRRKLRESIGGVGIRRQQFDIDEGRSSSGGDFSDADEFDEDEAADEEGRVQPSWEEMLQADPSFGQVATLVENLIKRGKKAVEYKVEEKWEKGRVLTTIEMEDRLEEEQEQEDEDAQSGSEGDQSVE